MDKKDIYEHLAKIYLDASSKKKKKTREPPAFKNLFFISLALVFVVLGISKITYLNNKNKSLTSEIALVICSDAAKINFHFNPARKEAYSVALNELDLNRFKKLGFSVRKVNYQDKLSLRVEFISAFKEKSEIYFKDIPHRWQDYKINLSEFKNISDWSNMSNLSFIVEEWNTKEKRGVVYIDNVRFLR